MGKSNLTGRVASIPSGLALGAAVGTAATVAISFIGAEMIVRELIPQEQIGYCSMGALLAGAILGALTASTKVKRRKLLVSMLSGAVFLCILLAITALFFGGQYDGFGVTAITVMIGCTAAVVLTNGKESRGKILKRKKR